MIDEVSANPRSRFKLLLVQSFYVIYYVIFSFFCLSMNLESFGRVWEQLGLFQWSFSTGGPRDNRSIAGFQPNDRPNTRASSRASADQSPLSAERSRARCISAPIDRALKLIDRPSLPIGRTTALIVRHTAQFARASCRSIAQSPSCQSQVTLSVFFEIFNSLVYF